MNDTAPLGTCSDVRWQQAAGVVQAQMAPGQTALLHLATARYHAMNEVGSRIWALLEQPRTLAALCEALCEEYDPFLAIRYQDGCWQQIGIVHFDRFLDTDQKLNITQALGTWHVREVEDSDNDR